MRLSNLMDFMNFRILNGFKRLLIFEVSCLLFEIELSPNLGDGRGQAAAA